MINKGRVRGIVLRGNIMGKCLLRDMSEDHAESTIGEMKSVTISMMHNSRRRKLRQCTIKAEDTAQ